MVRKGAVLLDCGGYKYIDGWCILGDAAAAAALTAEKPTIHKVVFLLVSTSSGY